jgi:hypothetical protein
MVWDLQEGLLLHQSSKLTSAPLTSLSFDPTAPKLAVGAADGLVMFFDLSSLSACRCLQVGGTYSAVSMLLDSAVCGDASVQIVLSRDMLLHNGCKWSIASTARIDSMPANMLQASRTKQRKACALHLTSVAGPELWRDHCRWWTWARRCSGW